MLCGAQAFDRKPISVSPSRDRFVLFTRTVKILYVKSTCNISHSEREEKGELLMGFFSILAEEKYILCSNPFLLFECFCVILWVIIGHHFVAFWLHKLVEFGIT